MIKSGLRLVFVLLLNVKSLFTNMYSDEIYKSISDICNPTIEDYELIEKYLKYGERPWISRLDSWQYLNKARKFKLLPRHSKEKIEHEVVAVNCGIEDRENCILLYSSFNFLYPKAVKNLVNLIKNSDYKGHIIYRIGGWPNLENGDLSMAHIPFSFKVCAFKEALRLGYKKALWLDAPMIPQASLNTIFKKIANKPFFSYITKFSVLNLMRDVSCLSDFGLNKNQAKNIKTYLIGILGFDFGNPDSVTFLNYWYQTTKKEERLSFSPRQEFSLFAVLAHRRGFSLGKKKDQQILYGDQKNIKGLYIPGIENPDFYYDKTTVQPNWPN